MWAEVSFVYITMNAFDGQTDGQTDFANKTVRMHSQSHGKSNIRRLK